jgi:signal transduction histidine kinase
VSALRREIVEYLGRHADPVSDIDGAAGVVGELLSNVVRHAPGPAWVSLAWSGESPVLEVRDLGPGFDLSTFSLPDEEQVSGRGCTWRPRS